MYGITDKAGLVKCVHGRSGDNADLGDAGQGQSPNPIRCTKSLFAGTVQFGEGSTKFQITCTNPREKWLVYHSLCMSLP